MTEEENIREEIDEIVKKKKYKFLKSLDSSDFKNLFFFFSTNVSISSTIFSSFAIVIAPFNYTLFFILSRYSMHSFITPLPKFLFKYEINGSISSLMNATLNCSNFLKIFLAIK